MNKKISTLMMGGMLLAVPSLVSAQSSIKLNDKTLKLIEFTAEADESNTQNNVLIIRDAAAPYGEINDGDFVLYATKNDLGEIEYLAKKISGNKVSIPNEIEALWDFEEKDLADPNGSSSAWYYGLKSLNTGRYLTVNGSANPYVTVNKVSDSYTSMTQDVDKKISSYFITGTLNSATLRISDSNNLLRSFIKAVTNVPNDLMIMANDPVKLGDSSTDYPGNNFGIILATTEERTVDVVDELNDIKGGKGFQFSVQSEAEDVIDNIFEDLDLRAFRVSNDLKWTANGNNYIIPEGVYLATDWSGVDEDILADNTFSSKDEVAEFQKLTLVAVSPTDYTKITNTKRADGIGFTLTTEAASEMNFYDAATAKTNIQYWQKPYPITFFI